MGLLDTLEMVPSSESEEESLFTPDPVPDSKPPTRKKPGPKPGSTRATPAKPATPRARTVASMAKEVTDDFTTMIEMGATMWGLRDECCAPTLQEQARPIAVSLVAVLERNPKMLQRFAEMSNATLIMQVWAVVQSLQPVAMAVYRNHGPGSRPVPGVPAGPVPNAPVAVDLETFPVFHGVPRANSA